MQVCALLRSFPQRMTDTVRSCTLPLATMVGDLPPSSRVTGTRFSLAAFITARPTAVLPVKTRWIERQGGECGAVAADNGDLFFGEELAQHRREHGVRGRCELRRFEHDAVSRGNRGDHRHQRQVDWVVPRRDDADHAERLILDAIPAEPHVQGDVAARRAHEAMEIALEVVNALDDAQDFHHRRLVA
jgi:hypothetical protein